MKITIDVSTGKKTGALVIGYEGENQVTEVDFDIASWIEEFGEGAAVLSIRRPGDANPYPQQTTQDGHIVKWEVSQTDAAVRGSGEVQLTYTVGARVKKSAVFGARIERSLDATGPVPDPYISWIELMVETGAQVKADADRAEEAAEDAEASAQDAQGHAEDAEASAGRAEEEADRAEKEADKATEEADRAEQEADKAEQAAANAGYMFFHIDEDGHLIYERTPNTQVDFYLNNGHLFVEAVA